MTVKGRVSALPDHITRTAPHYLYAAEFSDGTVKVGVTSNPKQRMTFLMREYRRAVVRVHVSPYVNKWRHQAEKAVLSRCREIGVVVAGNELFAGVKFGEATTLVKQMSRRKYQMAWPPSWNAAHRRSLRESLKALPA